MTCKWIKAIAQQQVEALKMEAKVKSRILIYQQIEKAHLKYVEVVQPPKRVMQMT